jgi:glycosyltransferase involved in cell wall biosynthesis
MPTVTCIIPVYNGERFVADAIRCVLEQTVPPSEIIVVDDGSTDSTASIVQSFGARIRYIRQDNQGPAEARNTGIRAANGDMIAFLDADDLWHTDKQERQLERLLMKPELDVIFAGVQNVAFDEHSDFNPEHWPTPTFSPCTMLARRAAFDRIGLFDRELRRGEDTEWYLRMMMRKVPYEVLPDVVLQRRVHGANLSAERQAGPEDVVILLKRVMDKRRNEGW